MKRFTKNFTRNAAGRSLALVGGRLLVVLAVLAGTLFCGKSIPVQELSDARVQLDLAEQEEAPQYAAESYEQAREALLEAHQALGEEEYDQARVDALRSTSLAVGARETSAPKMVAAKETEAGKALSAADAAYAEVLAAQDFAAAQSLFGEGQAQKAEAEQKSESANPADLNNRLAALSAYSTAGRKFEDATEAANKAKNLSLAQKGEMLDALDGIRSNLQKAEDWGAGAEDVNDLAAARATLAQAEKEIEAGELKKATTTMQEAEAAAKALLAKVAARHAKEKLAEAQAAVAKAGQNYDEINTDRNRKSAETADILDTISAQLDAAKEARDSASTQFEQNNHERSIMESEDAIRLSQIIFEQHALLASSTTRDSGETTETTDTTDQNKEPESREGWSEYTVKSKSPADCLWCIAKRAEIYGNGRLWNRIYQANKSLIKNPNVIFPGQRLWIPPKEGDLVRPDESAKDQDSEAESAGDEEETPTIMEKIEEQVDEALESEDKQPAEDEEPAADDETMDDDAMQDQPAESVE